MIARIWRWFFGSSKGLGLHNTPRFRAEQKRIAALTPEERDEEIRALLEQMQ